MIPLVASRVGASFLRNVANKAKFSVPIRTLSTTEEDTGASYVPSYMAEITLHLIQVIFNNVFFSYVFLGRWD